MRTPDGHKIEQAATTDIDHVLRQEASLEINRGVSQAKQ